MANSIFLPALWQKPNTCMNRQLPARCLRGWPVRGETAALINNCLNYNGLFLYKNLYTDQGIALYTLV
jgi:hypothetical protein